MTDQEYINNRLDNQIKWYSKKSTLNKRLNIWTKSLTIILSSLIPLFAGYEKVLYIDTKLIIGVLGVIVAIISSLIVLLRFQEKWIEYRKYTEKLKYEKYIYLMDCEPYISNDKSFNIKLLVSRTEAILNSEKSEWVDLIQNKDKANSNLRNNL